jgi:hypothetical protein
MTVLFLVKKFSAERGSVRRCIAMIQQPVLLSPKFGAKSSHSLTQSSLDVTVICGLEYFSCQDKLFVNNPLDMKDNDEHTLEFVF